MAISHYVEKRFSPANLTYLASNASFTANTAQIYNNAFCEATGENFAYLTMSFNAAPAAGTVTVIGQSENNSPATVVQTYANAATSLALPTSLNRVQSIMFSTNMTGVNIGYNNQEAYVTSDGGYTSHGVNVTTVGGGASNIVWNLQGSIYDFNGKYLKNPPTQLFYDLVADTTNQNASTTELVYLEYVVGKFKLSVSSSNPSSLTTVIWQCGWRTYK